MEHSTVTAVLLPNRKDTLTLIEASRILSSRVSSLIRLGESELPHITLVQFPAELEQTQALWQSISGLTARIVELQPTTLAAIPDNANDVTWLELQFEKSAAIRELQRSILESEFGQSHQAINGVGEAFRPHVTLGLVQGNGVAEDVFDNLPSFEQIFTGLKVAVGVNGPNYTFNHADYP